ncbi:MAG TPA: DUF349 domain-containing protein [Propionibacteriaceae bacterium]|nr:DUF349 domain-containing protein [Propionibacteriaceae bacterium]
MTDAAGPTNPADFGRVDPDGTVYVRTAEGERAVGQVPDSEPDEALAFFVRRFQSLEGEVSLFEARVAAGSVGPDDARKRISALRTSILQANAVGDLEGLSARLDRVEPKLAELAEARRAERAQAADHARTEKERMVAEAEKLAAGNDWRGGVNRFRALLEEWKALPRIDRATDDALWHRFSTARTTYTRRRKAQFAAQTERFAAAKAAKEAIIERARGLAESTDWSATSAAFRDLMSEWKAAGSASRGDDDALWGVFRGLQDQFFNARNAALNEQDTEFRANQEAKEALLAEAEAQILPVRDVKAARSAFRDFLTRYNEIGRVPREAIRPLDGRVRALEEAVREAEESEWRRTDPEARQRAQDTVAMFETQIAKLQAQADAAEAAGKARDAGRVRESIETYTRLLDQARSTLADFER